MHRLAFALATADWVKAGNEYTGVSSQDSCRLVGNGPRHGWSHASWNRCWISSTLRKPRLQDRKASPLCARLIDISTILSIIRLGVFHFIASLS